MAETVSSEILRPAISIECSNQWRASSNRLLARSLRKMGSWPPVRACRIWKARTDTVGRLPDSDAGKPSEIHQIALCSPVKFAVRLIASGMRSSPAASPIRSKSLNRSPTFLFLKRLDELKTAEELKANREKKPMQKRFFSEGKDKNKRLYQDFRWTHFKNFDPRAMFTVVNEHVFLWLRTLSGNETTYSEHMEGRVHDPHAQRYWPKLWT